MWYGTYVLPGDRWQTAAAFESWAEAVETMRFHAAGRGVSVSEDLTDLPEEAVEDICHPPDPKAGD